jgi:lysophospholipase L1-like esterase
LFGEIILRRKYPELLIGKDSLFGIFDSFDPRIGRWHKRNFSHAYAGRIVTINKRGLRDKELPYENRENKYRIIVLGDSVSWGLGVNDGETFSDFMERGLIKTDVINMGVNGFSTGEELLLLKYEGLRYKPNIVILFFYIDNDVCDNFHSESWDYFPTNIFYLDKGQLKIKYFKMSIARRIGIFLNERSYIINFINKNILKIRLNNQCSWVKRMNDSNHQSVKIPYDEYKNLSYLEPKETVDDQCFNYCGQSGLLYPKQHNYYMLELTKKIILEMNELCKMNNAKLIAILSPFKAQCNPSSCYFNNPLNKELMRFLEVNSISAIDLLSLFIANNLDPDKIFFDSAHFSVLGHKEVARLILKQFPTLQIPVK